MEFNFRSLLCRSSSKLFRTKRLQADVSSQMFGLGIDLTEDLHLNVVWTAPKSREWLGMQASSKTSNGTKEDKEVKIWKLQTSELSLTFRQFVVVPAFVSDTSRIQSAMRM